MPASGADRWFPDAFWCRNAALGFLPERVQHVNCYREAYGVDSAECVAIKIVYNFEHASTAKPFQRLGECSLAADLRFPKSAAASIAAKIWHAVAMLKS